MSTTADWFMVGITFIYVVATIAIWIANYKSMKLTEEQLKETKKQFKETKDQFEESKRLECMPFLQIELCVPERASFDTTVPLYTDTPETESMEIVKLRNIGNGTAINLIYSWECKTVSKSETDCMPICAIQKDDSYQWQLNFLIDNMLPVDFCGKLCLEYNDLLGNSYEQPAYFSFTHEDGELLLAKCEMDVPRFLGVIRYKLADNSTKEEKPNE